MGRKPVYFNSAQLVPGPEEHSRTHFQILRHTAYLFTGRTLTYPEDLLVAFAGITAAFTNSLAGCPCHFLILRCSGGCLMRFAAGFPSNIPWIYAFPVGRGPDGTVALKAGTSFRTGTSKNFIILRYRFLALCGLFRPLNGTLVHTKMRAAD